MSEESAKMDQIHEIPSPPRGKEPKRPKLDEEAGGEQPLQTPKKATAEADARSVPIARKTIKMETDALKDNESSDSGNSDSSSSVTTDDSSASSDEEPIQTGGTAENSAATKPQMNAGADEEAEKMDEGTVPALEPAPEMQNAQTANMPIIGEVKSLGPDAAAAIPDTSGEGKTPEEKADADTEPIDEGVGEEQAPAKD